MTMRNTRPLLVTGLGLWSTTAAAIDVNVCVTHAVDYGDASAAVGDDYLTDNSDVTGAGVRVQVIRNSDSTLLYDGYVAESGTGAGCATARSLSASETYKLRVLSMGYVNGNFIKVWNNDDDNQLYAYTVPSWSPDTLPPTQTVDVETGFADQWRILVAATWALRRDNIGLSNKNLEFYTEPCPGSGGSCLSGGRVYLCPSITCSNNPKNKYLTTHEMGHLMAFRANGDSGASFSFGYSPATCDSDGVSGHRINSEEYQGAAANEGIAHFWAAYAFNDETESDCGFDYYGVVNWDYYLYNDDDQASCEGAPDPSGAPSVDGDDYHGDVCGGTADKGVEYDWLRFFWDLVTDESIPVSDVFDIWDRADPDVWNTNGSGVAEELSEAADTGGWGSEYDYQAGENGTYR